MIRGFRYGTYVQPGGITLGDIYTYLAAGAQIARGDVTGDDIRLWIERTINGVLNEDSFQWGGGWIFGWSGVRFRIDPTQPFGSRGTDIMVRRQETGDYAPLVEGSPDCAASPEDDACYSMSGYWFPEVPNRIGAFRDAVNVEVLSGEGLVEPDKVVTVKSPAEVVADYLPDGRTTWTRVGRVHLMGPMPPPVYENPEMQPLHGIDGIVSP